MKAQLVESLTRGTAITSALAWSLLVSGSALSGVINTTDTTAVLKAIGVPAGTTATYSGNSAAIGYTTTPLANFPPGSAISFGILSNGRVADITQANTSGSQGTDLGNEGTSGDSATLTLNLKIPQSPQRAAAVGFNFTFLSEEYPEFVGSAYNDTFRAYLDGNNIALDTNGNAIDVNNDFFNAGLTPSGTFFDGQTPPLAIRAALPDDATSATLSFNVADVGDGVYDSAVFLHGVEYFFPQTLYLAFEEVSALVPVDKEYSFTKPSANLSETQQTTIVSQVQSIFDDFLIDVTNTRPTGGDYSTVYVGGTKNDLPADAQKYFGSGTLGKASSIDIGNDDPNDFALVFSGESFFQNAGGTPNLDNFAQVIAHEAGHILGLFHVEPANELMYPYADGDSTAISDSSVNRAEINQKTKKVESIGVTQNSYQELARNVGLENASIVIGEPGLADQLFKAIKIIFGSLFSTVYDAKLGVVLTDDAFPTYFDLGDLAIGDTFTLNIPFSDAFGVFLSGSSTSGGEIDIYGGGSLIGGIDPTSFSISDLVAPLTSALTLDVYQSDGSSFGSIGQVSLELASAPNVPEPNVLALIGIGVLFLVFRRYSHNPGIPRLE